MKIIAILKKIRSRLFPKLYPSKVYRRADLIRLMVRNPKKYNEFLDEIKLAYKQGRVK